MQSEFNFNEDVLKFIFYINGKQVDFKRFYVKFHSQFSRYRSTDTHIPYYVWVTAEDRLYSTLKELGQPYKFHRDGVEFLIKKKWLNAGK